MTEIIKQIFLQHVSSSLKLSVIIVLLFVLTKPIMKRYTAGFRYYSWLAVMIIFLIPFGSLGVSYKIDMPSTVIHIQNDTRELRGWYEQNMPKHTVTEAVPIEKENGSNETEKRLDEEKTTNTVSYEKPFDIVLIFSLVWLLGTIWFFSLHIKRYLWFKKAVKRISSPLDDLNIANILSEEKQKLKITSDLPVRISAAADTPMFVGMIRPFIILTEHEYADDELHLIFRHELIHYARKDILYQFITLIFISLHWFNPFAYIMAKAIEIDGETACDEMVLKNTEYETRVFYGEMLIKFLKTQNQRKSYMTTTFFGGKKGMKKRLTLIASKKTRMKGTAAMAFIMILTVMTSICAAAMSDEFFNEIFDGDTAYLADFVKTEKQSVSDENYTLTLEQYLVAEKQAMVIFSIEAHTKDAIAEFNAVDERGNSTFWDMDTIGFGPVDYDQATTSGFVTGSLSKKFDTERKRYFVLSCDSIDNKEMIDFYISTDKINGSPKITFPMKSNIETKVLTLGDAKIEYNPISIILNFPATGVDDCGWCEQNGTYFYFRMKNGEIKTYNQLYSSSASDIIVDENGNDMPVLYAWAKTIIKPDEIKSIIINDTEYPVDDVSNPVKTEVDSKLKPFKINAYMKDHLWLPIREVCEQIGADLKWDEATDSAIVEYRGSTYVFTVGSTKVKINGEVIDFYDDLNDNTTFIDETGRMIVSPRIEDNLDIDCHGCAIHTGDDAVIKNTEMHIIP